MSSAPRARTAAGTGRGRPLRVGKPARAAAPRVRQAWLPSARQVEIGLYVLAASGLLLFQPLGVPWSWAGPVLAAHVAGGVLLTAVLVAPFWVMHRRRLDTSRRPSLRRSGRLNEWVLTGLLASGFYLFLMGNRGGIDGRIAEQLHLWLTFPMLVLVAVHMARWSLLARSWTSVASWRVRARRFLA